MTPGAADAQPRLILASTSRHRRALLERLRIPFEVVAPVFAELQPPQGVVTPDQIRRLVLENAEGKAGSVLSSHPQSWVLASDQLGECEGEVLSKPGTADRALAQLRLLAGREHRLHTAVVLRGPGGLSRAEVVTNTLRIRGVPEERLRRYIDLERPLDAAGSYLSEGLGIALFDYLRGDDPTAIIGLPLVATCALLEWAGLSPLDPTGPWGGV